MPDEPQLLQEFPLSGLPVVIRPQARTSGTAGQSDRPTRGIPTDLLNKSECVIILPSVKKGGFIIAGYCWPI
jgi:hypothetical protein